MELRPYQQEAVNAVYAHLRNQASNPCVVLPTGTGKSLVLAQIAKDAATRWQGRIIILAHVKELLEQNADKIRRLCPSVEIGVYSAGLNAREKTQPVIVAGIQSVYKRACELGAFNLAIVDECHLIPPDGDGMYRQFLQDALVVNPKLRIIGLTATPYRLKGGLVCQPENILNEVCYEAGLKEMIAQGYLSPLTSKAGQAKADLSGLHIRAGEFIESEISAAMDRASLVQSACEEIVALTQDRRSVLIFCASVAHCHHVAKTIENIAGQECGVITGSTPNGERAVAIERFQGRSVQRDLLSEPLPPLKFLANVNVLTTGFDAPNVDCLVLLRPTASPGLYVQMVGRGTRLCPGKADCLVLDYGDNVVRHGPVDMVSGPERTGTNGGGEAPAKECPDCHELIHAAIRICPVCGFEFPPPEIKHATRAGDAAIMSGEVTETEIEIVHTCYSVHTKRGASDDTPKTLRIEYFHDHVNSTSEWVCPEHTGWARSKFEQWWADRSPFAPPKSAEEAAAIGEGGGLARTVGITVRSVSGEPFDRIIKYKLGEIPHESALRLAPVGGCDADDLPF